MATSLELGSGVGFVLIEQFILFFVCVCYMRSCNNSGRLQITGHGGDLEEVRRAVAVVAVHMPAGRPGRARIRGSSGSGVQQYMDRWPSTTIKPN